MLVPHRGDDAEFGKRRDTADQRDKTGIFFGRETVRDGQRLVDMRFALAHLARLFSILSARITARDGHGNGLPGGKGDVRLTTPEKNFPTWKRKAEVRR